VAARPQHPIRCPGAQEVASRSAVQGLADMDCISRLLEAGVSRKRRGWRAQLVLPPRLAARRQGLGSPLSPASLHNAGAAVQEAVTTLSGGGQNGAFSSKNTRTGISA
jgi:hypothetical protein